MRRIYTLALTLLLPYVIFHLLWRGRKQPEYLQHIGERFGFYPIKSIKPIIWLHTVSVGETRAAASLVSALQKSYPTHQILLTHTTPTGRAASEQLYGDSVLRVYLPYDYPFAVKRFLTHFQPKIGVLLETEIWANLIHQCHRRSLPLLLLNARLSKKSARGYAKFSGLTRAALSELAGIAAQTPDDAQRLMSLGATNVQIMGNLKYDIAPPSAMLQLGAQLRAQFGAQRKIFLAASTRDGEEELILDAISALNLPELLTIMVPRHPQRFDQVAKLIEQRGLAYQKRSDNLVISADTKVVLGDSMSEMFAYYAACDLAFIGGSLLPFGGQNLIEASSVGRPVLIGPHTYNFEQATELAIAAGAALRVENATELQQKICELFAQPQRLAEMGNAGLLFVKSNTGATEKALNLVQQNLVQG
jgi:3-deoxy-D-manno-octulosonic-acid transferase